MARVARKNLAVIFDGDDTLWSTEPLYDAARARARDAVSSSGHDGAAWEALQRRLDLENVATLGYSPKRFPLSCVQAYEQICRRQGQRCDAAVVAAVHEAAHAVFSTDAPLMASARATLSRLTRRGARLALLTKGDLTVQKRRLAHSGLAAFFDEVRIVTEKTPAALEELASCLGVAKSGTWVVGNSLRSDVLPALALGLRAIWIDAHVWEHERSAPDAHDPSIVTLTSLVDVPAYIAAPRRSVPPTALAG